MTKHQLKHFWHNNFYLDPKFNHEENMKKIAFFIVAAGFLASCTKWENKSTEFKVTGLWTGVNQEVQIQALPFLDSSIVQATPSWEANFQDNGSLLIDSAGTRIDSMGWAIENDTVLVLSGIDLGLGGLGNGAPAPPKIAFNILRLEETSFIFRYDTTFSFEVDPNFPAIDLTVKQTQRWTK